MNQTSIASIVKKFNGDSVSPILIFRRLKGNQKFFMESSRQYEGSGLYTYIGANPVKSFIVKDDHLIERNNITGEEDQHFGNPFEILNRLVPQNKMTSEYDFNGGLVGFATYDSMLHHTQEECEINIPAMQFDLYETAIIYSHLTDEVIIIHNEIVRTYDEANVDEIIAQIFQGTKESTQAFDLQPFESHTTDSEFSSYVKKAKQYIEKGEATQLFLTKRFSAKFSGCSFTMYRHLRKELPAPNMFYFEYPDFTIMGVAPDSIIKVKGKQVFVKPVTGARPRGVTPREDVKMELTLLQNAREVKAHNMLVDSTMADLEEICMGGTIHLVDYMKPMQFKHSIRLMTEIEGVLIETLRPIEALAVLIPPAASTGVPKENAGNLVREIEKTPRSFSGGIIGFVSLNGNIDFTLLQQSMVIKNERAFIQAGANILADSIEMDAILEIRKKLKAFLNIEL